MYSMVSHFGVSNIFEYFVMLRNAVYESHGKLREPSGCEIISLGAFSDL